MIRIWWLPAALLVAGCASIDGGSLVPGKSSAAEVKAQMGATALELKRPNGEMLLYFTTYPQGRENFVATIGADGVLRGIEQRLAPTYIGKVAAGMREDEVRELFGPPRAIVPQPRKQRIVWEYPWSRGQEMRILWLQFSGDGVVREVIEQHDYEAQSENG